MKAQYIEAPSMEKPKYPTVFLGGGISGCSDWQQEMVRLLSDSLITIYNPRRKNYHDGVEVAEEQIRWEYMRLEQAHIFSMWFAGQTGSVQPICLYELGRQVARREDLAAFESTVIVGVEGGYERMFDVYVQLGLVDSTLPNRISNHLEDHASKIKAALDKFLSEGLWMG